MQSHYRKIAAALSVLAMVCGLILAVNWTAGRQDYRDAVSELAISPAKEVPKKLVSQASTDQSLADAEEMKIKILKAKLKALESQKSNHTMVTKKGQTLASEQTNETVHPLAANTGQGYWDTEHKDDTWMPVGDLINAVDEEYDENEAEVGRKKEHFSKWNVADVGDTFKDETGDMDSVATVENKIVNMNEKQPEFERDDAFETPPEEITPVHRVPLESYLPWEQEFNVWMHSWMG